MLFTLTLNDYFGFQIFCIFIGSFCRTNVSFRYLVLDCTQVAATNGVRPRKLV